MGSGLRATCSCGFTENGLFVGGGMTNFMTYCGAPGLCDTCGTFGVLNYLEDAPRCAECGGAVRFYNDSALQEPADPADHLPRNVFEWNVRGGRGPLILPDVNYLCPHCHQKTLRFEVTLMWD